ncbi:hypothetical protein BJY16_000312 [Actinoplanes octamycinicus]|uniref:phospholipase D n=1 Tax=Actinoplanes octamycinicus TaxID=135948 RepID=A0A7W7GRC9_9ACTN|nr:phospholipase D-like domain-containing protein [Actinoplanes octamycinicus]MBB4736853.1 hypothetical protein [Actinoplanes octamycinicus]GIE63659.1 hypothetical protein Aoc01nite_90610 [Actinoplanes octamycinicus]
MVAVAPAPAPGAGSDPVIGSAVFNDPAGGVAARYAIHRQLARIIDRVPAGETIRMSWFGFTDPAVAGVADTAERPNLVERLRKAHARGVDVRIVLDHESFEDRHGNRRYPGVALAEDLGTDPAARSFLTFCREGYGCIGKRLIPGLPHPYNHNKFLIASRIVRHDGGSVRDVVFQSSGNLGAWDAESAFNNALTWSETGSYTSYLHYFEDLVRYAPRATGAEDYHRTGAPADAYRTYFFPRPESGRPDDGDPIAGILDEVSCGRGTGIRVVMWAFTRVAVATELARKAAEGCRVDVVYAAGGTDARHPYVSPGVLTELRRGPVGLRSCGVAMRGGRTLKPHSKYLLIDGPVPQVLTGSANLALSSLRNADEIVVRVRDPAIHRQYLANFHLVSDRCAGKL